MYLSPRIDLVFKKLFGVEENKDLLMALINSVVDEQDWISEVELLNPYNERNFANDKLSILDIKAKGSNGQLYNIEIQITDEKDYDKRALSYWAKLYTSQLQEKDPYSKLNKTIGIHILNFLSIPETRDYHHVFDLKDRKHNIHKFKDIQLHTLELIKFGEESTTSKSTEGLEQLLPKIKTSLDRWVTFLGKYELLDLNKLPRELEDPYIQKACQVVERMNLSKEERAIYEGRLDWLRMEASALEKAEEKGIAQGITQGIAQGITQGIAQGITQGIAEKSLQVAKNMLAKNLDLPLIVEITGLTVEELMAVKKELEAR